MATDETLLSSMRYGFVATGIQPGKALGKLWYKTVWDLISDIISLRPGDSVVFWLYQRGERPTGVAGIFEVESVDGSRVFYDPRDVGDVPGRYFPFRALINARKVYGAIAPDDLLLADVRYLPWVSALSAKKALGAFGGRGRSSTPLPPAGVHAIGEALEEASEEAYRWDGGELEVDLPEVTERYPFSGGEVKLHVDVSRFQFPRRQPTYPGDLDFAALPAIKRDGQFVVEKALEAWLMENADNPEMLPDLLEEGKDVLWFANYVPCSVSGVNMDAVITYKSADGLLRFLVAELKVGNVYSGLERSLKEVGRYVRVARRLLLPSLKETYGEQPELEAAILGFAGRGSLYGHNKDAVRGLEQRLDVKIRVVGYRAKPSVPEVRLDRLYP